MLHVRHAAAAINEGLCKTVLITHGESGRSRVGAGGGFRGGGGNSSLPGQFEAPYGPVGPPSMFTIPVLRYLKTYGLTERRPRHGRRSSSASGRRRTRAPAIQRPDHRRRRAELADDRLAVHAC